MAVFVLAVCSALLLAAVSGAPTLAVSNTTGFKDAAQMLLQGIDETVDPCQDFYAFTCNIYLKNITIPPGASRIGTYDQSQELVYSQIAANVANINAKSSVTERIFLNAYQSCMLDYNNGTPNKSHLINMTILSLLNGLPMLTPRWSAPGMSDFWNNVGVLESQYGAGSFFSSYVSVDYGNHNTHALYINQGNLVLPRDYYTKPENMAQVDDYLASLQKLVKLFNADINGIVSGNDIDAVVTETVQFEIQLALAMVPDDLLRNYKQQYNVFTMYELYSAYPNINWTAYIAGLLKDVNPNYQQDHYVLAEPAFFGVLDSMIGGQRVSERVLANFVGLRVLLAYADFLGGDARRLSRHIRRFQINKRTRQPVKFYDADSQYCADFMTNLMPYGSGYIYVANIANRKAVVADIARQTDLIIQSFLEMAGTLKWLDAASLAAAKDKNSKLVKNIGWPWWFSFTNSDYMDNTYHKYYLSILNMDKTDYFTIYNALQRAYQRTENFALLEQTPDRQNFGGPPSEVNAWYIPERNSITFPFAAMNPPYYRLDFPQAYNYAGQGGTAGHELTHGYDDEGVQFGGIGELSDCNYDRCGWMDKKSTLGFIDMAQCVVSQYSEKCCPLKTGNVHCASGTNTQGENIADLGGQQAAYKAYRKYIAQDRKGVEEDRLPGLEKYTPNQIFWITYGFSWCMKQQPENLVHQLLTNPHAPGSCRVNQVMQDIPEFGQDFKCTRGTPMYPQDDQRCHVWTDKPL